MLFQFHKHVFVLLTIPLIIGILISDVLQSATRDLMYFAIAVTIVSVVLHYSLKRFKIIKFFLLFCFLGFLIEHEHRPDENIGLEGEKTVLLNIEEYADGSRIWKRGLGTITGVYIEGELHRVEERILFYSNYSDLSPGDQLVARIDINSIANKGNPGEFNAEHFWNSKQIRKMTFLTADQFKKTAHDSPAMFTRWIQSTRSYLINTIDTRLPQEVQGVAKAILLGEKSSLSDETRNSFGSAGAMHVLAVSGLHVGIILVILIGLFKLFPRVISNHWAHILALLIIWFYAGITGFSPSVIRASFMFSMIVISRFVHGNYRPVNALFFAAFCNIIIEPYIIYDIGFQLSYSAMLGIFLLYDPLQKIFYFKQKVLSKIWQGTSVGIAAQSFTIPLTLYYFHQFPNYFMVTNIGIMALAGVILFMGLLLFTASKIPGLSQLIAFILGNILLFLLLFIGWIEKLPGSVADGFDLQIYHLVLLYTGIFFFMYAFFVRRKLLPFTMVYLLLFIGILQFERYHLKQSNEIVIFNSRTPLLTVKLGDEIICIQSAEDEEKGASERILKDYQRIAPGKIRSVILTNDLLQLTKRNNEISIRNDAGSWQIITNQDTIVLVKGYDDKNSKSSAKRVGMPYLKGDFDHSLNDGAFRKKL